MPRKRRADWLGVGWREFRNGDRDLVFGVVL